jgi:hypothetical protein
VSNNRKREPAPRDLVLKALSDHKGPMPFSQLSMAVHKHMTLGQLHLVLHKDLIPKGKVKEHKHGKVSPTFEIAKRKKSK